MKKAISVSLAKVDYDFGERYIEIIADCPRDYVFSGLNIDVDKLENNAFYKLQFTASQLIENRDSIVLHIKTKDLGIEDSCPAMFYIILSASPVTIDETNIDDENLEIDPTTLVLSDVSFAHEYFMRELLTQNACDPLSDDLIKKYLMLYAHQAAMANMQIDVAKEYYKLICKGFSRCGDNGCSSIKHKSCNCHD